MMHWMGIVFMAFGIALEVPEEHLVRQEATSKEEITKFCASLVFSASTMIHMDWTTCS